MKKYWKVRYDSDMLEKLKHINMPNNYIKILLEEDSDMMKCLESSNYVYISYNDDIKDISANKFGWEKCDDYFKNKGYEYLGEINLRKEKLKKLKNNERLYSK